MTFDFEKLKDILVCPQCRVDLVRDADRLVCTNPEKRCSYPILDEIPRLLADEAQALTIQEWTEVMQRHHRDPSTGSLCEGEAASSESTSGKA